MKKEGETTAIVTDKVIIKNGEEFLEEKVMDKIYVEKQFRESSKTRGKMLDVFLRLSPNYEFSTYEADGIKWGKTFYESSDIAISLVGKYELGEEIIDVALETTKWKPLASAEDSLSDKIEGVYLIINATNRDQGLDAYIYEDEEIELNEEFYLLRNPKDYIKALDKKIKFNRAVLDFYKQIFGEAIK